ncbi:MAG: SMC-Scp complex subunit ScpB [Pirellulales bacterium]|nr:SMC-Scp complex subunit ScpB [Pirellulales bacterium]
MSRLEAVLFLSREPLSSRKLAKLANLADGTEARNLVRVLRKQLTKRQSAFQIHEVGGGFQLLTQPEFAPWMRRLRGNLPEIRLSSPAMETLAIVAYRQPILRADIEAIRGVGCAELLRQLMERDLLRIVGRSDELGRPFLYGTTKFFLQVFGLRDLDELTALAIVPTTCGAKPATGTVTTSNTDILSSVAHDSILTVPCSTGSRPEDDIEKNGKEMTVADYDEPEDEFEADYEFEDVEEYDDEDPEEEDESMNDEDEFEDDEFDEDDEEEYDDDELDDEWEEVDSDIEDEDDEDEEYDEDDEYEYEEDDEEWDDEEEDEEDIEDEEEEEEK